LDAPARQSRSRKGRSYQDYETPYSRVENEAGADQSRRMGLQRPAANSYKVVPAYAWVFSRNVPAFGPLQMAGFTFATSLLSANRTDAVLNPAG